MFVFLCLTSLSQQRPSGAVRVVPHGMAVVSILRLPRYKTPALVHPSAPCASSLALRAAVGITQSCFKFTVFGLPAVRSAPFLNLCSNLLPLLHSLPHHLQITSLLRGVGEVSSIGSFSTSTHLQPPILGERESPKSALCQNTHGSSSKWPHHCPQCQEKKPRPRAALCCQSHYRQEGGFASRRLRESSSA